MCLPGSSARVIRRLAVGWVSVGGPAGGAPACLAVRPHTAGRRPRAGESAAYVRRRRHPLTHLYPKRSQQLGSWVDGPGGTPGGLVTSPAVTYPLQAGPGRRAAAGRHPDRLGRACCIMVIHSDLQRRSPEHFPSPTPGRERLGLHNGSHPQDDWHLSLCSLSLATATASRLSVASSTCMGASAAVQATVV